MLLCQNIHQLSYCIICFWFSNHAYFEMLCLLNVVMVFIIIRHICSFLLFFYHFFHYLLEQSWVIISISFLTNLTNITLNTNYAHHFYHDKKSSFFFLSVRMLVNFQFCDGFVTHISLN